MLSLVGKDYQDSCQIASKAVNCKQRLSGLLQRLSLVGKDYQNSLDCFKGCKL